MITSTPAGITRTIVAKPLDDSVSLVRRAFMEEEPGDLFVRRAATCSIEVLADTAGEGARAHRRNRVGYGASSGTGRGHVEVLEHFCTATTEEVAQMGARRVLLGDISPAESGINRLQLLLVYARGVCGRQT